MTSFRVWSAAVLLILLAPAWGLEAQVSDRKTGLPEEDSSQNYFRPLYLSGKVVLEDGSPPPQPAIIELRCDSQRQPQQYTDSKGGFNFRVGGDKARGVTDSQRQLPGQEVGTTKFDRSFVSLTNCELQASLPGYASNKINLGRRSVFESPDVGTLVLRPLAKGEGTFVSLSSHSAPEDAKKAFGKAEKELAKEKPDAGKVASELGKAVAAYPQFAAAWQRLGETRVQGNDVEGGRTAFQKAAEADPKFIPPRLALARMNLTQNGAAEAAKLADEVLRLAPGLAEAHYYKAVASVLVGNVVDAEPSIQAVQASGDAAKYPRVFFLMGNILAQKGDVAGAAAQFRKFLELEPSSRAADAVKQQLAEWQASGALK